MDHSPLELEFIEFGFDSAAYRRSIQLRNEVLRRPLGLDILDEDLSGECNERHFGLMRGDQPVASVTIRPIGKGVVKLRQMCVDPTCQHSGLGRLLVTRVEEILKSEGVERIELSARLTAVRFYERLQYCIASDVYIETTIPHQKMAKDL